MRPISDWLRYLERDFSEAKTLIRDRMEVSEEDIPFVAAAAVVAQALLSAAELTHGTERVPYHELN